MRLAMPKLLAVPWYDSIEVHPNRVFTDGLRWLGTPTRLFLIVALLVGSAVALLARPFAADDETTHFERAYAITRGDLVAEVRGYGVGSELPKGVVDEVTRLTALGGSQRSAAWRRWNAHPATGADEFVSYPMATLSPGGHASMAIGIGIGRMLGAARLSSLILWGPPGTGKTTIARLLSQGTKLHFEQVSAIFSGLGM